MQIPQLPINDRFTIELVCDTNYQESLNTFIEGHINHPFMKALKATKEELNIFYSYKFENGVKNRPIQSFAVRDQNKNNKIVACLLTTHFSNTKEKQQEFKNNLIKLIKGYERLEARFQYDNMIEDPTICQEILQQIDQTQNPYLFQQVSISVLPEYFQFGLFQKMLDVNVYNAISMGSKGYVDVIYNKGTGHVAQKYFNGKIIHEIPIKDHIYQGQKIFNNKQNVLQLIYSEFQSEYCQKIKNNHKKYRQFYINCIDYVIFQEKYKNIQIQIDNQQEIQQNLINNQIISDKIEINQQQLKQMYQIQLQNIQPRL